MQLKCLSVRVVKLLIAHKNSKILGSFEDEEYETCIETERSICYCKKSRGQLCERTEVAVM